MLRSRRLALAAAAVLIGLSGSLAGCGDAAPRTSAAKVPAVIHLGAMSPGGSTAEAATADRMMMPVQNVTFVFDGTAPDLGADALAWTLSGTAQPDVARIAEIAHLLGAQGEVREVAADQGGGWMVGAADYSTATLTVSADAMSSWWFNPSPSQATAAPMVCSESAASTGPDAATPGDTATGDTATGDTATGDTAPSDTAPSDTAPSDTAPSDTSVPVCSEPAPPTNVPDEAAALAAAKQMFSDMGYDGAAYDYETYADEWGANVTAYLLLDGHRSPISMSVGFGAEGAVTWASGFFATPEAAANYPLVGVDAGVARLNDDSGRWMGSWGGPNAIARMDATVAGEAIVTDVAPPPPGQPTEPGSTEPAFTGQASTGQGSTTGADATMPVVPNMPVDPIVPMEPITVHLTGATLALTMVWAADDTIWLLPAYSFTADDGGMYTVIAVDDSFIDLPAPFPTDSLPIEPMPVESTPVDSVPVDSVPVDGIVIDDPLLVAVDAEAAAKALVGVSEKEAAKIAADRGWGFRVSVRDGANLAVTADYSPSRVNVEVSNGLVVAINSIG